MIKTEWDNLAEHNYSLVELTNEGEAIEDGEVSDTTEVQPKYNLDKIVDYPGFNVPVPEGIRDVSFSGGRGFVRCISCSKGGIRGTVVACWTAGQ